MREKEREREKVKRKTDANYVKVNKRNALGKMLFPDI